MKPVLIHTHFHRRRTGVTRSVENILPFFDADYETYIYGYGIEGKRIYFQNLILLLYSNREVVVHCHRNNEIILMLLLRFFGAKFKLIFTRHAETEPSRLTKFLLKKSDKIITLVKSMGDNIGIKNTVVGHGVDVDLFLPNHEMKLFNIKQENIVLCAGRVRNAKGQKILVEAISPVLKVNKNWALVIVGKVDNLIFLDELQKIIRRNQVENQVYFIDETSEIISYYQASKTVVVPSFTEGFSLVCAEAMSCECTVIATKNVGVHSYLISDRKNGYLFKGGDIGELERILLKSINQKIPHLGKQARKEILKNWSVKGEIENLIQVYKS